MKKAIVRASIVVLALASVLGALMLSARWAPFPIAADAPVHPAADAEPELAYLPGGTFLQGSDISEKGSRGSEYPKHKVTVHPFRLAKTEVTRAQFAAFVEATGYRTDAERNAPVPGFDQARGCYGFKGGPAFSILSRFGMGWLGFGWTEQWSWRRGAYAQSDDHPVVCVSWNDAQAYIAWLNKTTGKTFRLPSESELEFAIRASTATPWPWGTDPAGGCEVANYSDATTHQLQPALDAVECRDGSATTARVGSRAANRFGVYDLSGNVWEWAQDCWRDDYSTAPVDGSPAKHDVCEMRSARGGGWVNRADRLRSAARIGRPPTGRGDAGGFRLAQDV